MALRLRKRQEDNPHNYPVSGAWGLGIQHAFLVQSPAPMFLVHGDSARGLLFLHF